MFKLENISVNVLHFLYKICLIDFSIAAPSSFHVKDDIEKFKQFNRCATGKENQTLHTE